MGDLLSTLNAAKQKGLIKERPKAEFVQTNQQEHAPDMSAVKVLDKHLARTPDSVLQLVASTVEGFSSYWSEELEGREQLVTAEEFIDRANRLFSSYSTIRRGLDTSVAYLVGDWLLECRKRFFPGTDRKAKGEWHKFLTENLCDGFEKTTAYLYMAIAERLGEFREQKLPIRKLEAVLKVKNSGKDVQPLLPKIHELSVNDILSLAAKETTSVGASQQYVRLLSGLQAFNKGLDSSAFGLSQFKREQREKLKAELRELLAKLEG